jgi:CelD/BcsL family acetyltransferase involved in cellulose biosynthesis
LAVKGEYHHNFLTAQAEAGGVLDREAQSSLFDRLDWLETLHRMCLRDHEPLLLHASDGEAELWLPLMQMGRGHVAALANWYNFHWRPIFGRAHDEVTKLALLRQVANQAKTQAKRLTLSPLPDEDHSATLIANAFQQAGWSVFREQCDENHYLDVKGRSFDAYWEGRPSRLKNTVKRKGKSGAVTIRIERDYVPESWADYERVYARSWKPHEGSPEFLRQLAERESIAGAFRLGLAYIDGLPVAAQFWTVENGTALIHKLAHDERHLQASPGTLLSAALFQHVVDIDHVDTIDFGTGNDAYKAEWMEEVRPRYRLELFWPNHPANWPHIAIRNLRAYGAGKQEV